MAQKQTRRTVGLARPLYEALLVHAATKNQTITRWCEEAILKVYGEQGGDPQVLVDLENIRTHIDGQGRARSYPVRGPKDVVDRRLAYRAHENFCSFAW